MTRLNHNQFLGILRIEPDAHIVPRKDVGVGELGISPPRKSPAIHAMPITVPDYLGDQIVEAIDDLPACLGHFFFL
jgi:hypothetical protein